jgi:hypothetical protein
MPQVGVEKLYSSMNPTRRLAFNSMIPHIFARLARNLRISAMLNKGGCGARARSEFQIDEQAFASKRRLAFWVGPYCLGPHR